jgi:hypothetical protein
MHSCVIYYSSSVEFIAKHTLFGRSRLKFPEVTEIFPKSQPKKILHAQHHLLRYRKRIKDIAASGFDPPTSGLWAQHASTAPRCLL